MTHDERREIIKAGAIREARDPRTRRILLALAVLMLVLLAVTSAAGVIGYQALNRDVETQKTATGVAVGTADTNKDAAEDLCAQVRALGKRCTTDPTSLADGKTAVEQVVGKQGVQGIQGVQGVQGEPGSTASAASLRELIRPIVGQVFAANPPADGKDGAAGATGATGATGSKGDTGPKGEKGDTGVAGRDGTNGTNGLDGRGIASLVCTTSLAPITFTLTLTDGTVQEFTCGTAGVDPAPEPTTPSE